MIDLMNGILELFSGDDNIWALIVGLIAAVLGAGVLIADNDDADIEITSENLSAIIDDCPSRDDDIDNLKPIIDNDNSIHNNETIIPVFYGTNRDVKTIYSDDSIDAGKYSTDKGHLRVGLAFVSIPKTHIMGKLDQPSLWRIDRRKVVGKHIYVKKSVELSIGWFQHLIAETSDGDALLFVHGFNTDFLGGLRRSAQLAFDLNVEKNVAHGDITSLPLTTFYFSWPSFGKPLKYVADQAQVDKSEEDLIEFLRLLKSSQGIKNITIIAHSMGNRLLTRALYNISMKDQNDDLPKLGQVILAAPDVDKDQYNLWEERIAKLCKGLTIYASKHDKALKASKAASDTQRLGDASHPIPIYSETDTIDVSNCGEDILSHTPHGSSKVLSDINELVRNDTSPDERFWLTKKEVAHGDYWELKGD